MTQLFLLRQQRAQGFLASLESFCAEPIGSGRVAWVDDCARTMVNDFRKSERAVGAVLTYRNRRLIRSGSPVAAGTPTPGALAKVIRTEDGAVEYLMRAALRDTALTLQFDHDLVGRLFDERAGLDRNADVFLVDHEGQFLTRERDDLASVSADREVEFLKHCRAGSEAFVDLDHRGVKSFQSFRPLKPLGTACVAASLGYEDALAPAEKLRADLVIRGSWFVLVGAVLSLVASHWISRPVRRLAVSARKLQTGRFDRPVPVAGPSEVRALGRAFNAMGNDLAELVAKEQAARRVAEDANHAKDEFLATVSHELRTPLNAILGWAQMLRSEKLPADQIRHGISVIERSARAQTQLIDDLLDVSRIVSKRLRIAREPVALVEVIDAALDAVRPQAAAKQVEIETDLSDSGIVLGDPRRLEQVVWNLAWNAVKFSQTSGKVSVRLKRVDRQMVLSVTDTGVGISSAFLPYVFEWFRQEDARSRSQSGLGLGLGIVRHLVQLHGGSVRAESGGLGKGATFTVTLPIHKPAAPVLSAAYLRGADRRADRAPARRRADPDRRGRRRYEGSGAGDAGKRRRIGRGRRQRARRASGNVCGRARRADLGHPHARGGWLLPHPLAARRRHCDAGDRADRVRAARGRGRGARSRLPDPPAEAGRRDAADRRGRGLTAKSDRSLISVNSQLGGTQVPVLPSVRSACWTARV